MKRTSHFLLVLSFPTVRSGAVYPYDKHLNYTGNFGYYWSSTPYSNGVDAYNLYFLNTSVYPSYTITRYYGFSLRCLARELRVDGSITKVLVFFEALELMFSFFFCYREFTLGRTRVRFRHTESMAMRRASPRYKRRKLNS